MTTDLIAEDLLLLLLDDESGKLTQTSYLDIAIGGALLTELAIKGAVEVGERGSRWSRAKVRAVEEADLADPVLRDARGVVGEKERTAEALVNKLGKGRRGALLARLQERGLVTEREDRVLGVLPRKRWPAADGAREAEVRARLGDVLVRGLTPTPREAALVSLLRALGIAHKVVDREGVSAREVKRRAQEVAEGDWAAKAVRDAVAASQAAVTAVIASTAVASSGG